MNTYRVSRFQVSAVAVAILTLMAAMTFLPMAASLIRASVPQLPKHILNSLEVVTVFHNAMNSDNVDELVNSFADDATVVVGESSNQGKEQIRRWALNSQQMVGLHLELLNFRLEGEKVIWLDQAHKASETGHGDYIIQWEAVIRNGKIQSLTAMPRFRLDLK